MADDLTPGAIRARKFSVSRRGYDRSEVGDFMVRIAGRIDELEEEIDAIHSRLAQLGIEELPDFKSEIDELSVEIRAVMDAAMKAAAGMRSRAQEDADAIFADAEHASMAARGDAWDSGSEMLQQAQDASDSLLARARDDALFIRAEAEQDAKRLVAEARRQAEELVRSSREKGERIVVHAKAESEAILEAARQSAEKAQERARALENRRSELLSELESAEAAMRELESLKSGGPSVGNRVTAGDDRTHWPEDEGAIRILPAQPSVEEESAEDVEVDAEAMAAEVAEMQASGSAPHQEPELEFERQSEFGPELEAEPPPAEPESAGEQEPEFEAEPTPALEPETVPHPQAEPAVMHDKTTIVEDPGIADLFARLREPAESEPMEQPEAEEAQPEPEPELKPEPEVEAEREVPPLHVVPDLETGAGFERRDRMLLPIENTALRGLKRRIVELQNRVLEELRTSSGEYRLGHEFVVEMMGDEMDVLLTESYRAGHAAAAESISQEEPQLTGGPHRGAAEAFSRDLHRDVKDVLRLSDELGARRISSDLSRVFRSWRTDDAERAVRTAARRAFNDGLLAGYHRLGVAEVELVAPGRPCGQCAADTGISWAPIEDIPPGGDLPPLGPNCAAMVVPKGWNGFDEHTGQ